VVRRGTVRGGRALGASALVGGEVSPQTPSVLVSILTGVASEKAAEPLEGKSNGAGKAACDSFKAHADEATDALNGSLGAAGVRTSGGDAAIITVSPCPGVP